MEEQATKKPTRVRAARATSARPPAAAAKRREDDDDVTDVITADDDDDESTAGSGANPGRLVAHVGGAAANVLSAEEEAQLLQRLSVADMQNFYMRNSEEGRAHYQQSLELFEERTSITEASEDILLKKAGHHFRYSVQLRLLQSKLYNALMFVARPNLMTQDFYSVSLDYLEWIVDYNSNDKKYLRDSLRGLQKTLMEIPADSADNWYSTQIVGEILIKDGVLMFTLPEFIRKLNAAPERFYYYSMRANAKFKSRYAQTLYELLCENLFRGQTGHMSLKAFRDRMGVAPDEYPEFKRLKQRVIQPALDEVDEIGDIAATVHYGRENRFITSINFMVARRSKALMNNGALLDPERFKELREDFGLSQHQITELIETYPVERVEAILDVLLYRYVFKEAPKVKGSGALFKSALKNEDRYQLSNSEKAELAAHRERRKRAAQLEQAQRREVEVQRRQVAALQSNTSRLDTFWAGIDDDARQAHWDAFLGTPESTTYRKAKRPRPGGLPDFTHPAARAGFISYLERTGHL
ncbi:replication initiation protein [Paraburkholderia youngii]|uniref:replication initiation protein n=1 Tax=Paraburkholderia youngii TaxID=2782701 RepID=UPI003D254767